MSVGVKRNAHLEYLHKQLQRKNRKQEFYILMNIPHFCRSHPWRAFLGAVLILGAFLGALVYIESVTPPEDLGEFARHIVMGMGCFCVGMFLYIESFVYRAEWKVGAQLLHEIDSLVEEIRTCRESNRV